MSDGNQGLPNGWELDTNGDIDDGEIYRKKGTHYVVSRGYMEAPDQFCAYYEPPELDGENTRLEAIALADKHHRAARVPWWLALVFVVVMVLAGLGSHTAYRDAATHFGCGADCARIGLEHAWWHDATDADSCVCERPDPPPRSCEGGLDDHDRCTLGAAP